MAPCAKRDVQRVPWQLGVAMGARAADQRCVADPHLFSPASAAAFLLATSRRRVSAEQLVVMIVLLLFLQKQNLANAIYLFRLGTLLLHY